MPQAIVGMELDDIRAALGADQPAFRAKQIYDAVYRQKVADLGAISNLPKALRARLSEEFPLGLPTIERRYDSVDGTVRYLLKLADGKTVETVWMPENKSRSLDFARDDMWYLSTYIYPPIEYIGRGGGTNLGELISWPIHLAFTHSRIDAAIFSSGEPSRSMVLTSNSSMANRQ